MNAIAEGPAKGRLLRPDLLIKCMLCLVTGLFIVLISKGISVAQEVKPAQDTAETQETRGIPYDVVLEGDLTDDIRSTLTSVSDTIALKDRPPISMDFLRRRAREDETRFLQALRSLGYYGAETDFTLDESRQPVTIVFHIRPGQVYVLSSITIEAPEGEAPLPFELPSPEELGLMVNDPARAQAILNARDKIVNEMTKHGYAFAEVPSPRVVVDHDTRDVTVAYKVDPGAQVRFGSTSIEGLRTVEEEYVRRKIHWRKGQTYNGELVEDTRLRLVETGLFSLVRLKHPDEPEPGGMLPITIELTERKHRSISAGINYMTDQGPGGRLAWEHRNLFGAGETLRFDITASEITYSGTALFKKPYFLQENQSLLFSTRIGQDDTDAYTSRYTDISSTIERQHDNRLRYGAGPAFRLAQVDEFPGEEALERTNEYALASFPVYLNRNTTDNLLDPTRGSRLLVQFTPYMDTIGEDLTFLRSYATYSHYWKILERPFCVFAGRVGAGSITGAAREDIPADIRFYAGGGGSIRGYDYQKVGPLFDDKPLGGRSLLELSAEFRFRVTEKIGFVVFLDGGSAFESEYPSFDETVRWGAGTGIRYLTPVGPLRVDFAVPLDRVSGVHDPFQVYFSLGQAF